jgi:hypothetical protein
MPTLLAPVAITNSASRPNLGIKSTWVEIILAFRVSKAALIVSDCTTRPGKDFRHKSVNGTEQFVKWRIHLRQNEQKATKDLACFCVSGKGQSFIVATFDWDV